MTSGPGEVAGPEATSSRQRRRPRVPAALPIVAAIVVLCWAAGLAAVNLRANAGIAGDVARRIFPTVRSGSVDTTVVDAAWAAIRQHYWRSDVDADSTTQSAVSGIVDHLRTQYNDRFSSFFTRSQYSDFQNSLNGRHSGSIGVELEARCAGGTVCPSGTAPSVVVITGVLHDQPAERAGVMRGDIVTAVNGTPLTQLAPDPAMQIDKGGTLVRGPAGTTVTLSLRRGEQSLDVTVTRADLALPPVYTHRFGAVLDLQVTAFNDGAGAAVAKALKDAMGAGATAVVLDLRHNPGGLVSEAQSVASQFLIPGGDVKDVVVRRGGITGGDPSSATTVEHDTVESGGAAPSIRLTVLIDGDSASAAEIVAAALHDYHRAALVGERTYGKGSVQEDFGLPDGSDLHLTVEKWFGPGGESIDGSGIAPDTVAALPSADARFRLDAQSGDPAQDTQLGAALAAAGG